MSRWETDLPLGELMARWLDDLVGQVKPVTAKLYQLHVSTHLLPFFESPHLITRSRISQYSSARLKVVKRTTVQKERSTLRGFLAWCHEQGYLPEPPEFPSLPRRAAGTPHPQRRRGKPTDLAPEECRAIISVMPAWSTPRGGRPPFPVQPRFIVAHELGFRPATMDGLSQPEHWSPGESRVRVTDEIDKARFGREVPLTQAAQDALESVARPGLLFGCHDYRPQLLKAAKATGLPMAKVATFCAYDLRHARATELAETGNLPGVAYVLGHKRVSTTSLYVRPGLKAAERVLEAAGAADPITSIHRLAKPRKSLEVVDKCERRDLNSYGVSTASTSSHRGSDEPAYLASGVVWTLEARAVALLEAAISGAPVSTADALDYVRASLLTQGDERSLWIAQVIEGGAFTDRALVELARSDLARLAPAQANEAEQ